MPTRTRILVVGNGMVGNKFVETFVRSGGTAGSEVVLVGEEPTAAYDRVHLSRLFDGAAPDDLLLASPDVAADPAVSVLTSERVVSLDAGSRSAATASGRRIEWDYCVLATGSYPFVPDVPGRGLPGCFVYRTLEDVDAIRAWAEGRQHGVVVGGGLLGLEAADALRRCGLATEIVEFAPWLMPSQVDQDGGEILQARIAEMGFQVHTGTTLSSVEAGDDGAVGAVSLSVAGEPAGGRLVTEMVVFAAGIRPRDELARSSGLEVGPRGGIVVDERCRTSAPRVFAIGECAVHGGRVFGLVAPGYQMARVAAESIQGRDAGFLGGDTPTKLKLLGVDVASFGDAHAGAPGASTISFTDRVSRVHKRIVVDQAGRVTGGVLVGDCTGFELMAAMAAGDVPSPESPSDLIAPAGTRPGPGAGTASAGLAALPASATICSCENVCKGRITEAIAAALGEGGSADVAAVKKATGAGTGCGGCVPQVAELVRAELEERGVEVSRGLCEHLPLSRSETYDLVRLEGITTFSELISRHGRGSGCEICKPTVASILASLTDRHILDGEDASLQDTNDHFLANMQRDGTYSVVPRVPGGEITPEKLVVLGEVAREFGLYVKLTGGQRIDLLGARVEDLPAIWARLVDAGFESGHAYGKAVRTVKSCVGTTWCRYGVQDSTTLAIDLELRYRGLRSPHKVKMAVSGCARECAEAQSKDVGVIATERGWNLYVCGNGGTRPRHADLLAEDLDRDRLVRLIDRFLMYYVRTADRLQRTSTWLESMEGGIEQLRRVVVDDVLGVADDLERDMDRHVQRYRCEWAETLADPRRLARFRSFVNTDQPDPDVVVVHERSQPRPARDWERVELLAGRA